MYMSCEPLSQYSPTEADLDNCHYDSIKYSQRIDWRAAPEILSTTFLLHIQYNIWLLLTKNLKSRLAEKGYPCKK